MPTTKLWDVLCYVAGAVAMIGPMFIVYFYFRAVRRRLREFHKQTG